VGNPKVPINVDCQPVGVPIVFIEAHEHPPIVKNTAFVDVVGEDPATTAVTEVENGPVHAERGSVADLEAGVGDMEAALVTTVEKGAWFGLRALGSSEPETPRPVSLRVVEMQMGESIDGIDQEVLIAGALVELV